MNRQDLEDLFKGHNLKSVEIRKRKNRYIIWISGNRDLSISLMNKINSIGKIIRMIQLYGYNEHNKYEYSGYCIRIDTQRGLIKED